MLRHLMLVPSLACPARCHYCFGPRGNGSVVTPETLEATLRWASDLLVGEPDGKLEVVFHGGEPLAAGEVFFRVALIRLRQSFAAGHLRLSMQSNLWLLTDELSEIFEEFGVLLGTSLDGPQAITDAQRGRDYFRLTLAGIERARRHGLGVGCICTFTRQSATHAGEIFDFFVREGLDFTVHAAVPPLIASRQFQRDELVPDEWSLSPEAYGELLVKLLDFYLANLSRVRIHTLDSLCRSVSAGEGGICTFRDCLGDYLAVAPDGGIYPCQRFAGHPAFCLGHVQYLPNRSQLEESPVWKLFHQREERIEEECGDCPYFAFCRGGCPYNALAAGGGVFRALRDPYCPAYQRIFSHITDRALEEVFSEENLHEVVAQPAGGTLLRRGPLISLMRGSPHPRELAHRAQQILAAVALGANERLSVTAQRLVQTGLARSQQRAEESLSAMARRLATKRRLNNLYLHVTFDCNLHCSHCYASAGSERLRAGVMPVEQIVSACSEAAALGFRQAVITGGEPLMHPDSERLLEELAGLRAEVKPLLTVLRTNLALPIETQWLARLGRSVDQIGVSIDGDKTSHDARRGNGSYECTVANLRAIVNAGCEADLSLTAILSVKDAVGAVGEAVRALARELGIRVHFRPILPLGRALQSELEIEREAHWAYLGLDDAIAYGFSPAATCGIGQNLYVEPDGNVYPCYARCDHESLLGNIAEEGGLRCIIESPTFKDLSRHTVDSNRQCSQCALRYLCSGACRAWSGPLDKDLDAPPVECLPLHDRARSLLVGALTHLGIPTDKWIAAGLPLPESPPGR
jgi:uncharacterized protein